MQRNCIVGQSGGPTAVINSSLVGVYKTAIDRGATKVYGMLHGVQGLLSGKYVNLQDHIRNDLDIEILKRTPSSYLGSCRYKLPEFSEDEAPYKTIFSILNDLDISHFFYIGGNDSMDTISKLFQYAKIIGSDITFIGIPKTIDNDLAHTDHTPGFGSAAKYIGSITKEIICDGLVYDTRSVTIIEIMGRNAGWLTGAAALSRGEDCEGPDMILLPEIPFSVEQFIADVDCIQQKRQSIVIAVSEGLCTSDGEYVSNLTDSIRFPDSFGHFILTGTARYLANRIAEEIKCKTRAIEFSTLQRCASHISSKVDISEAFQVGGAAVKAAFDGESGKMITLNRLSDDPYQCTTDMFDVDKIANQEKLVPLDWITQDRLGVTKEFVNYVRPLVQSEMTPIMVDGLPRHLYHDKMMMST